ncbi:hypothetical protein C3F09_04995 [candidate division GN15 bacterium]|uniref:Thioredoxin domain-containing protein n=1 Tax=candidate division GN15 bacterium TaxID=2072418 RepID=A0A855X969_9BACT|nr:MAG: hypothetical protein C3F09_04995 [candidate division GN15 bacterium]
MRSFRRLAYVTVLAVYFLIFVGGLVRVAGAGLGCPDWPKCFGRWIPPLSTQDIPPGIDPSSFNLTLAWIEYGNRLVGMAVGLLVLATAMMAIKAHRKEPRILYPSLAAALLTAYQGWQGGKVVASNLQPVMVSVHLLLSFLIVSLLVYVAQQSYYREKGTTSAPGSSLSLRWAAALWGGGLVQTVLGTFVRGKLQALTEQFTLLPDSQLLARVGVIQDVHMLFGMLLAIATWVIGLLILRLNEGRSVPVKQAVLGMMALTLVQIGLGFVFLVSGLSPVLQLFHLWIAGLYIGLSLALFFGLRRPVVKSDEKKVRYGKAVAIAAAVVLMAIGAATAVRQAEASRADIPVYYTIPDFSFAEPSGKPFTREDFLGKVSVVNFFFTSCRSVCPVMNATFAEMYRRYAYSDKLQLVSFTVDPETDTLAALRAYAAKFGVSDNRWQFVRAATPGEISRFCEEAFKVSGDLPGAHSTKFVLVDAEARIRGYYDYDDPTAQKRLAEQIAVLAAEIR